MTAHLSADHYMRALDVETRNARSAALRGDDDTFTLAIEGIGNVAAELEALGVPVDRDRIVRNLTAGG
jgi:hypothetical protein